ncbi:putative lipid II flippase FtsW [Candidatus Dependentiae bacterium]|nr:putative lipid II flippase FtsW [Candidatus Dependentiae bacterium]
MQVVMSAERLVRLFILLAVSLAIVGLVFIYSSSSVFAQIQHNDPSYFVKKQALGLLLGIVVGMVAAAIPGKLYYRYAPLLWLLALGATALTLVPGLGKTVHGSSRWLALGPIKLQPSEWLRVCTLLLLARFIARYEDVERRRWWRYGIVLGILGMTAGILLLQPDFGMAVTIVTTGFALLFVAYPDPVVTFSLLVSVVPIAIALIVAKPYRMRRLLTFLDPWQDPQGAGYQVIQSLTAIGSGGLVGLGIGNSRQKFLYLPMQHTDFIIAIIAEEIGFIGTTLLLLVYLVLLWVGMRLAFRLQGFARYVVLGFVVMMTLQTVINVAVALGLVPTKGIGLPFISYGVSLLVSSFGMLGIIRSVVRAEEMRS